MAASEKRVYSPGFTGLSCTALLIVSHLLSRYSSLSADIGALNTVLRIIALCECVQLVRVTSAMSFAHVWNSSAGVMLFSVPVVNLLVTAVQLFPGGGLMPAGTGFTAILTLFSLPAFFCYYFAFYLRLTGRGRGHGMQYVLPAFGFAYTVIRIADKALFPALAAKHDLSAVSFLVDFVSCSSSLSLALYAAAAVGFVLSTVTYKGSRRK